MLLVGESTICRLQQRRVHLLLLRSQSGFAVGARTLQRLAGTAFACATRRLAGQPDRLDEAAFSVPSRAKTSQRVALELGGNDAMIVFADAT